MKYDLNYTIKQKDITPGMYSIIIYQLLRQYSNVNNKLTINDIFDTLSEYWQGDKQNESARKNIQKTIKRNLPSLMSLDPNICAEKKDGTPYFIEDGKAIQSISKIWYEQQLTPTDVQLLTDAVINSKHFTNDKRRKLLRNLLRTIGETATTKTQWFETVLNDAEEITVPISIDLYRNLEFINQAIAEHECLSFDFCFARTRGRKYKVRSFTGVSPYKIIHNDGTYYLIASRKTECSTPERIEYIDPTEIMTIEIHKLDNIQPDASEYVPIEETEGKDLSIQGFLHHSNHPIRSESVMFFLNEFNDYAALYADAEGLDILIEKYGTRITATKIKEIEPNITGTAPELRYLYEVTLHGISDVGPLGRVDWKELAMLCIKHPHNIKIVEPEGLIDGIITCLEWTQEGHPGYWDP